MHCIPLETMRINEDDDGIQVNIFLFSDVWGMQILCIILHKYQSKLYLKNIYKMWLC